MRVPDTRIFLALAVLGSLPGQARALDPQDTRMVAEPALSEKCIAFAYANDLWTAALDGSGVRRLTSHPGVESGPRFSPDGRLIAFTGRYEGNTDVYIVPSEGGVPRRLTWHPGPDTALGFTPDGKSVIFSSNREVYTNRYVQLFTVPIQGGWPQKLPVPHAVKASLAPDGRTLAYVPLSEPFHQWKHYRGGTHSRILVQDLQTLAFVQVPQPEGRCNDTDPCFLGDSLYFRSDRDGEFNLYRYDRTTKTVTRLTRHTDFPVVNLSAGGDRILYEQAGFLHLFDPRSSTATRLKLAVPGELPELRSRYAKGAKYLRETSISPTGARVAVSFRGEILTLPREKGDDRNLTRSPGAHDRSPAWSPDGRTVAYFSDEGGEYALWLASQDGKGSPRRVSVQGSGFYEDLAWAPDGKKLSYTDNARAIWVLDLGSGQCTKVGSDPLYGPEKVLHTAWSPDSAWLAYTRNSSTYHNRIWLYSLVSGKSIPVTDGLSDARNPAFDAGGKFLTFLASTDAGPAADWFSQASADMRVTSSVYLAVLAKGVPSPLQKQSDEEAAKAEGNDPTKNGKNKTEKEKASDASRAVAPVVVDAEGLSDRIVALPIKAAAFSDLTPGPAGQILYLLRNEDGEEPTGTLQRYDFEKRREDTLLEKVTSFQMSADLKRILLRQGPGLSICDYGDKLDPSKFKVNVEAVQVRVEPSQEWRQIFEEAWRINRDFFYDPGFHGADWKAMREKYAPFLPHLTTRQDLNRLIQWMCSELSVGHHRVGGGDTLADVPVVPGGLLGADLEIGKGRYRFKKVFGGLNWNPDLRSPLTEPGVDVKAGDYLLAVEGVDLKDTDNFYALFERTAGRTVELTVGPGPDGKGSRTVKVVPIESDSALRNRDWVEGNLQKVTEATKGRVAYVYVPNTANLGHTYFKRYFFPQADREAIIVDERHNGGGNVADYYIDILRRPFICSWAMRYGADLKTPIAGIQGPKAMIIDETAGSGGDLLPWMFRKLQLGPLVGKRTWGGLVGILGFPELMDGGFVMAPNLAIWTEDGFIVENQGVPPDIEVEQTPAEVMAGRDPQLEKAIEIVMKELEQHPVVRPQRPPFPVRVQKPQ